MDFDVFAQREREGWANHDTLQNYETLFGPVTRQGEQALADAVSPTGGSTALDLCCGQGGLSAAFVERGAQTTGLDFSEPMLAVARQAVPEAEFIWGDAQELPFEDGSFDAVASNFGLPHVPDQPKALSEIARVLRPGGRFAVTTWTAPPHNPAFGAFFGAVQAHGDMSKPRPAQPDFFQFSDPDQARTLLSDSGLSLTGHETREAIWELENADGLFRIFAEATVSAALLIRNQPEDRVALIREAVAGKVEAAFRDGDAYRVPVRYTVVSAAPG